MLTRGGRADGRARWPTARRSAATRVLSNADPKRTFLSLCERADLPDEFVARIEAYRCMGTSIKINLGGVASCPTSGACPRAACSRTTRASWS